MEIKQSVKNTFARVGIDYETLLKEEQKVEVANRFGGGSCETSVLVAKCIERVYELSNQYESGTMEVTIADFDRLRYFILEADKEAYSTCID